MQFLILLFGTLLGCGLFFILTDVLKLPRLATGRAMLTATKQGNEKVKSIETMLTAWSVKLSKYLPMDEYKKIRLKNTLNAAGMKETPEEFTAYAMLKSGLIAMAVIPCLLVFPLLAPIVIFLSVVVYFKEIRKADEKLSFKRDKIERSEERRVWKECRSRWSPYH